MYFCWGKAARPNGCARPSPRPHHGSHPPSTPILTDTPLHTQAQTFETLYIRNLSPSEAIVSTPFPVFYAGPCWAATISLMMVMASLARPSRCSMDATCIASAIATERPWVEFGTR